MSGGAVWFGALIMVVVLPLLRAAVAASQTTDSAATDAAVGQARKAWQVPGAAIAIVSGDTVVHMKGYGVHCVALALLAVTILAVPLAKTCHADTLPTAGTGGKNGGPISILFIFANAGSLQSLDPHLAKRMGDEGCVFQSVNDRRQRTAD